VGVVCFSLFLSELILSSWGNCALIFFIFLGVSGAVGRGWVGGVRSVTVGVQFQRHPSRQAKGGVNPNLSAETVSECLLSSHSA